ncbi:MAG: helix-turn-helix domain-containing protein [Candidatus Hodarchaeota archaeon]
MSKQYRNKDWLYQKYWEEGLSVGKIARLCNCEKSTIRRWMKHFNIEQRDVKEAQLLRFKPKQYWNKKWLYRKYWKESMGVNRIAALCPVDRKVIRYWLCKHGIERRNIEEIRKLNRKLMIKRFYGPWWMRIIRALKCSVKCFKKYVWSFRS